jgi:hypothetical protein
MCIIAEKGRRKKLMKNVLMWLCIFPFTPLRQQEEGESVVKYSHDLFITNSVLQDGFGSQFQNIIAAVIYAELNNKTYVYSPFQKMEHNYDKDRDFIAKKEQFINFIDNFAINAARYNANGKINYKAFFDANVARCAQSSALKKIKTIFRANKNTDNYFNNNNVNIAIHIRRSNSHDSRISGTDAPDRLFLDIINQFRVMHYSENPLFHLYSQGNSENFEAFQAPDIILHINKSIEDTFLGMVLADILVAGASSFSYTAALLSEGTVYYIPFWHAPLPHWISVNVLLKDWCRDTEDIFTTYEFPCVSHLS